MPYLDVYIGGLSQRTDPLDWGGDPAIGNVPVSMGPAFPPDAGRSFRLLIEKIECGALSGKQVDWGAWAANVCKSDIINFIKEAYDGNRIYSDPTYVPHLYPRLQELMTFVDSLSDVERFALVASEL